MLSGFSRTCPVPDNGEFTDKTYRQVAQPVLTFRPLLTGLRSVIAGNGSRSQGDDELQKGKKPNRRMKRRELESFVGSTKDPPRVLALVKAPGPERQR